MTDPGIRKVLYGSSQNQHRRIRKRHRRNAPPPLAAFWRAQYRFFTPIWSQPAAFDRVLLQPRKTQGLITKLRLELLLLALWKAFDSDRIDGRKSDCTFLLVVEMNISDREQSVSFILIELQFHWKKPTEQWRNMYHTELKLNEASTILFTAFSSASHSSSFIGRAFGLLTPRISIMDEGTFQSIKSCGPPPGYSWSFVASQLEIIPSKYRAGCFSIIHAMH